jgi:circadian clock protein KaiB
VNRTATVPQQGRGPDAADFELVLYVAGQHANSTRAMENLHRICDEHLAGRHHIEIVHLLEHPEVAREAEIFAVPTLVRRFPHPARTIIGDLSDTDRVLAALGLRSPGPAAAPPVTTSPPPTRSAAPIAGAPMPDGGVIHHRADGSAHLGHPALRDGVILLVGALVTALWGISIGNVVRWADLNPPLPEVFAVTNRFALAGAAAGAISFLILAKIVVVINRPGPRIPLEADGPEADPC